MSAPVVKTTMRNLRKYLSASKPSDISLVGPEAEFIHPSKWDLLGFRSNKETLHPHVEVFLDNVLQKFKPKSKVAVVIACSVTKPYTNARSFQQTYSALKGFSLLKDYFLGSGSKSQKEKMELATGYSNICDGVCWKCPYEAPCSDVVAESIAKKHNVPYVKAQTVNVPAAVDILFISSIGVVPLEFVEFYPAAHYSADNWAGWSVGSNHQEYVGVNVRRWRRFLESFKYEAIVSYLRPSDEEENTFILEEARKGLNVYHFQLPSRQTFLKYFQEGLYLGFTWAALYHRYSREELHRVCLGLIDGSLKPEDAWRYRRPTALEGSALGKFLQKRLKKNGSFKRQKKEPSMGVPA